LHSKVLNIRRKGVSQDTIVVKEGYGRGERAKKWDCQEKKKQPKLPPVLPREERPRRKASIVGRGSGKIRKEKDERLTI